MNNVPQIIVNTGFEVDQNGVLTEIVIPKVVSTCNAPGKITFEGNVLNYIPTTTAALQDFTATDCTSIPFKLFNPYTHLRNVTIGGLSALGSSSTAGGDFYNLTELVSVNMSALTTLQCYGSTGNPGGTFYGCLALASVVLPSLATISESLNVLSQTTSSGGTFYNCTALESVTLPELRSITCTKSGNGIGNIGTFYSCTSLKTVTLPKLASITNNGSGGVFYNCTALETVTLGGDGHAVTAIANNSFNGCIQSGLTITIYTSGGASLSGEPWGATNATIEYEEA